MKQRTRAERAGGFLLSLLLLTALVELSIIVIATAGIDEVADASPFGRNATITIAVLVAATAVIGTAVAWRGVTGHTRTIAVILVFVSVGIVAVLALFFALAGGLTIGLAILLAHTAVSMGMTGRAILRTPTGTMR